MTWVEELFLNSFEKVCINKYPSDQLYRHPDLYNMAKKFKSEGKNYFYCIPEDPNNKYGHLIECEPIYEYRCNLTFSESDFESLKELIESDLNVVL